MRNFRRIFLALSCVAGLSAWPGAVLAQSAYINPDLIVAPASAADWSHAVTGILRLALGIAGLMFLIRAVWGLFLMATHGGNEENIATAVETIEHGVIGAAVFLILAVGAKPAVGLAVSLIGRYWIGA